MLLIADAMFPENKGSLFKYLKMVASCVFIYPSIIKVIGAYKLN